MNRATLTRSFVKAQPFFIIAVLLATSAAGGRNVAASSPSLLATGGPDGFGYIYIDSNEPGGPTFNWEDISGTGTPLTPITPDYIKAAPLDDVAWNRTIGFSFNFYGANYTQVAVDSNGYLNFDSGGGDFDPGNCCPDCPIPDTGKPNTAIYGLWEDLNPDEGGKSTSRRAEWRPIGASLSSTIMSRSLALVCRLPSRSFSSRAATTS
jgi:hypothetical protein